MPKEVWVKADWPEPWEDRKKFITSALEAGVDATIVPPEDLENTKKLGNIKTVSNSEESDIFLLEASTPEEVDQAITKTQEKDKDIALSVEISGKELEEAAAEAESM